MPNEPSQISLNFLVAQRAMRMIVDQASQGYLEIIGLSLDDFKKVTGNVPWSGYDRPRNTASLNTLLNGSVIAAGLPPFELPVEWIAAGILVFVAPINIGIACVYLANAGSVSDLGKGKIDFDRCTAQQLFALCVALNGSNEQTEARRQFEDRTKIKFDQYQSEIGGKEDASKKK